MGAVTVQLDTDGRSPVDASNAGLRVRAKITMSNSYATGGDTIAASLFGVGMICKLNICGIGGVGGFGSTTGYAAAAVYDSTGVNVTKIQVFGSGSGSGAAFAEVTNGTNLATVIFDCEMNGT